MTEEEYRNKDAISQSYLTLLDQHPSKAKKYLDGELKMGDVEEVKMGNAVDDLLTKGEDTFRSNFEIVDEGERPTGQIFKMMDYILRSEDPTYIDNDKLEAAYKAANVSKYSLEKMVDRFQDEAKPYLDKVNSGKQLISPDQEATARYIVDTFKLNEFTGKWITHPNIQFQVPVFFETEEEKCKGLVDACIFQDGIIYPLDLKVTSYSLRSFDRAIFSKRYDLQAEFYTLGLRDNYPDYKIAPFRFIVDNMKFPGAPVIYRYETGNPISIFSDKYIDGKTYKSLSTLIKDHKYHVKHDRWDYKREVLENEGEIEVIPNAIS